MAVLCPHLVSVVLIPGLERVHFVSDQVEDCQSVGPELLIHK